MRDIKFRLWCENKQEWEKNSWALSQDGNVFDLDRMVNYVPDGKHVLEQFTGLKDRNGKEIYEGDLVRIDDGDGWIIEDGIPVKFSGGVFHVMNCIIDGRIVEVIGNIHQNPELLNPQPG